ncbi:winged helix-turn-helix transcriptional regulator [Candidatus Bipolaricaulota bacterium]|nr:winged helix-turn-helix transcriptional regulator [Candidatus Bipolaricaulota bacterium]
MKNIEFKQSLGHLFHIINLNMRKKLEKDLKDFGFSSSHQFAVLLLLSKQSLSQKEISDVTLADEPSTTRMLDRMIKKEIIGKKRSTEDKRKQVVYITDKGLNLLKNIMPIVEQNNKNVETLIDEEELEQLFTILNKINNRMQNKS